MNLHQPSTGFASIAVFVSASLWGLYWIPLRYLESKGIDGGPAVALVNFPAAILLIAMVVRRINLYREYFSRAATIGLLTGLGLALYAMGLVYSSVVRATLLFYLTPIWATLIGIFWLNEIANWQRWAAIAGGLLGLVLLVSGGNSAPLNIGDLFALLSGVFWALGAACIKRYNTVPLASMMMFQFFFTTIVATALGFLAAGLILPDFDRIYQQIIPASLISILVILPAVLILFWAQKFLFPGRVGLLMMSEVLVAVISASIFLPEERMGLIEWSGAALIIGACLIEVMAPNKTNRN